MIGSLSNRSCTWGNLKMIEIRRARLCLASWDIMNTFSRQLKAISMMSLFSNRCWDFSLVKMTMKDFMIASLSSICFSSSWCSATYARVILRPELSSVTDTRPCLSAFSVGEFSPKIFFLFDIDISVISCDWRILLLFWDCDICDCYFWRSRISCI